MAVGLLIYSAMDYSSLDVYLSIHILYSTLYHLSSSLTGLDGQELLSTKSAHNGNESGTLLSRPSRLTPRTLPITSLLFRTRCYAMDSIEFTDEKSAVPIMLHC